MKKNTVFILLLLSFHLHGQVELKENERYEGNTALIISSLGVSFTIPSGWFGGVPQGSSALVLADVSNELTIILTADEMIEGDILIELQKQIPLDGGISIYPADKIEKQGKRWWGDYHVSGAPQEMKSHVEVRLGDHEIGIVCIVIALPNAYERGKDVAASLLNSMKFSAPQQLQQTKADSAGQLWSDYLKGKSLKYFYSKGEFSETDFIHLCSNGEFARNNNSSSGGATGSAILVGSNQGKWQATGSGNTGVLTFLYQDGSTAEFNIQYGDGNKGVGLYLNNSRYYVDSSTQCE